MRAVNKMTLTPIVWNGEPVITCADIDRAHNRPSGTARRNFLKNKKHMIEAKDYYKLSTDEIRSLKKDEHYGYPKGALVFSKSGYLMIVKSLNDSKAWEVQRKLVESYFTLQSVSIEKKENELAERYKIITDNDMKNIIEEFLKQQMLYMEHEKESNDNFKEVILQSLSTLSGMVIKNCELLNQIIIRDANVNVESLETKIEQKSKRKRKERKVKNSEYEEYKKYIEELCWEVVNAQPKKYANIASVKNSAYDILNRNYGLCLAQDRRDYYREFEKMPNSTIELLYWLEQKNKSYKNLLSVVLKDMAEQKSFSENNEIAISFPCINLEQMEDVVRAIGKLYRNNGINNIHFYRRFFSFVNKNVQIEWNDYEQEYRRMYPVRQSDRVGKIDMLKTNKKLVDLCLPYFNNFVKNNYANVLK